MSIFYLDASAWVKYYVEEPGSDWVEQFWEQQLPCASSELGLVEVLAALIRRRAFEAQPGVLDEVEKQFGAFHAIALDRAVRSLCPTLLKRHSLRGADCVHLASAIHLRNAQGDKVVLIASDGELLTAARAEGFDVLNPAENPPIGRETGL
jgi:predicted nucleic acid-binding protein